MEESAIPTVIEYKDYVYNELLLRENKISLILFTTDNHQKYVEVFREAAKQMKGQYVFVISGMENED